MAWAGSEGGLRALMRVRMQYRMLMAEMAITAMAATMTPAFAPVLRVFTWVTSLAGCREVEGKDDEDAVVTEWFALMFLESGVMNTLGRNGMRLLAVERLESHDVRLFAFVAAVLRLNVEWLLVLDAIALDAAGVPALLVIDISGVEVVGPVSGRGVHKVLVMSVSWYEVVGLGSDKEDQVIGGSSLSSMRKFPVGMLAIPK